MSGKRLQQHLFNVHKTDLVYKCDNCDEAFEKNAELLDHVSASHGYTCKICNETFAEKSELRAHAKSNHLEIQENVPVQEKIVPKKESVLEELLTLFF